MAISVFSQSTSPLGKSTYRFVGIGAPAMYIPFMSFETKMNGQGTNIWVKLDSRYPLTVETQDGVISAPNELKMHTEFSCLQNVVSATEAERLYDEHVLFLLAHKSAILSGNVIAEKDTPVIPDPDS